MKSSPKYGRYSIRWSAYGHRRLHQVMKATGHTSIGKMVSHAIVLYRKLKTYVDNGYEFWAIRPGQNKEDQKRLVIHFGDQGLNGRQNNGVKKWPIEGIEDPIKKGEN